MRKSETRRSACSGFIHCEQPMLCSWPLRLSGRIDVRSGATLPAWTIAFAMPPGERGSLCSHGRETE